ncbi:hypothetical protein MHBO_001483 [Bonamia ostreae]|uniref:Uncharacterized protein n=1 Tax=Bonamia ostreae TaxID=126728 RepID=A0ABV2AJ56_9EUKA
MISLAVMNAAFGTGVIGTGIFATRSYSKFMTHLIFGGNYIFSSYMNYGKNPDGKYFGFVNSLGLGGAMLLRNMRAQSIESTILLSLAVVAAMTNAYAALVTDSKILK